MAQLPRKTTHSPATHTRSSLTTMHGRTWSSWRIGSGGKTQPRHTTECSVAQRFDGDGAVFAYARIWDKNCVGCKRYGRGLARSVDGGETFDTATLRGLPDTTRMWKAPCCRLLTSSEWYSQHLLLRECSEAYQTESKQPHNVALMRTRCPRRMGRPACARGPGA